MYVAIISVRRRSVVFMTKSISFGFGSHYKMAVFFLLFYKKRSN
nr:MAG TPA: hypothetical protein [Caudoviricetes sp.]